MPSRRATVSGRLLELVGEKDDRVQGRAQLVRHGRQEVRLEPIELGELAIALGALEADPALATDRAAHADQRAGPGPELHRFDRLSEEVVRARLVRALPVDRARRHEEDRNVVGAVPGELDELVAGSGSEHDVDDGEVERLAGPESGRGRGHRVSHQHLVPVGREISADQVGDLDLVVDDENPPRLGAAALRRPGLRAAFDESEDAPCEGVFVDRLGDEAVATGGEGALPVAVHRMGRHRHDGDRARSGIRPDLPRCLPAREQGQRKVHQHEIGALPPGRLDGGPAVGDPKRSRGLPTRAASE